MKLKTSKTKMLGVLSASLAFVAIAIWDSSEEPVIAWAGIFFFGLCSLVALISLLPGSSYLDLQAEGFETRTLYRKSFVRWVDTEPFVAVRVASRPLVGWSYVSGYTPGAAARKRSLSIAGVEDALPETYGLKDTELVQLMNTRRANRLGIAR